MFGHDNQHHDTTLPAPDPDGALTDDQAAPLLANDSAGDFIDDGPAPAPAVTQPSDAPAQAADLTAPTTPADSTDAPVPDTDTLLKIKQQALQQLTPLVHQLDQSPEENFRTIMMMIQAADGHELIKDAYEAALQITDAKARAQALLDVVNEVNYFITIKANNDAPATEGEAEATAV